MIFSINFYEPSIIMIWLIDELHDLANFDIAITYDSLYRSHPVL